VDPTRPVHSRLATPVGAVAFHEVADPVAAIASAGLSLAIDVAQGGLAGDDAFEPGEYGRRAVAGRLVMGPRW